MQFVEPAISTICVGQAASAAAVLLAAGAPGKRYALPNARVLIHQPHGRRAGPVGRHRAGRQGDGLHARADGRDPRRAHRPDPSSASQRDIDRDYIVRGEDAVAYGLVDHVISKRELQPVIARRLRRASRGCRATRRRSTASPGRSRTSGSPTRCSSTRPGPRSRPATPTRRRGPTRRTSSGSCSARSSTPPACCCTPTSGGRRSAVDAAGGLHEPRARPRDRPARVTPRPRRSPAWRGRAAPRPRWW